MTKNFKMIAKTFFGLEEVLANELRNLGAQDVKTGVRMVSFLGDKGFMYKANIALRTALKILKPIKEFRVYDQQSLYNGIKTIDWSNYIATHKSFVVDTTVNSTFFNHSQFVAFKVKDAIVDQFREKYKQRPNIDKNFPDLRINIHIQNEICSVSLDTSGSSLHHRGYRKTTNIAPINEVLVAGMLLLSGWNGQSDFLDPMCGSGTILIEATMIACNIPPNLNRKEFAFEKWNDWDNDLFDQITESLLKKTRDFDYTICGFDKAPSAVQKARENSRNADLSDYIDVRNENFFNTKKETNTKLFMLFNPPYGERLNVDLEGFYKQIGNTLKQNYSDTESWFITANLESLKFVGLKPSRKIKLFNGKLEARLVRYDLYQGSKKRKYIS